MFNSHEYDRNSTFKSLATVLSLTAIVVGPIGTDWAEMRTLAGPPLAFAWRTGGNAGSSNRMNTKHHNGSTHAATKSDPMMQMPMVIPLFVENQQFSSTLQDTSEDSRFWANQLVDRGYGFGARDRASASIPSRVRHGAQLCVRLPLHSLRNDF
jgi:hypothetical protein